MTNFKIDDDYMTPFEAWEDIAHLIPHRVIWEPFYGDGTSGDHLRSLGFDVIHEDVDFFDHDLGEIIVTNPPFSIMKTIIPRLKQLDKPFILILPAHKLNAVYLRNHFKDLIQLIIPRKRINFLKYENGELIDSGVSGGTASFGCLYYCYKIGLPRDILWL